MSLGEWLEQMRDAEDAAAPPAAADDDGPLVIETPRADAPARYEAVHHPADEVGKVAAAIERLTARIEAAEQRSTLAITGIDQSVRGALARLETSERDQTAVAARFEGAVDEIRTEQQRAAERLRRMEADAIGPRSTEALKALEGQIGKVASQVYEGRDAVAALEAKLASVETAPAAPDAAALAEEVAQRVFERMEMAEARTNEALRDLGATFLKFDSRLRRVEADGGGGAHVQTLAASLNGRLEEVRREMAEGLRRAGEGSFDRVERKLSEMSVQVQTSEQRSALALERMGREMVSMADNLSRRVQSVEGRSAQAVEQVGAEVSKIAGMVEKRLSHTDGASAQALERLGGEIARITERLSERIANSERRSAQAIDDIGEQLARVTERIGQRQERVSTDLADRIRQSEERTARLLDEAREKIGATLAVARASEPPPAAPPPAQTLRRAPEPALDPFAPDPFSSRGGVIPEDTFEPTGFDADDEFEPPPFKAQAFSGEVSPFDAGDFPARDPGPGFSAEDFDAAEGFAPLEDEPLDDLDAAPAPVFDVDQRQMTTREVIEQARMAARTGGGSAPAEPRAAKAEKPSRSLFGLGKKAKQPASPVQTATLAVVGVLAFGGVAATGIILSNSAGGSTTDRIARMLQIKLDDSKEIQTAEADTAPKSPRVAMAVVDEDRGAVQVAAGAATLYGEAVRKLEAKDPTGLDGLRQAANQGYAPAQFYLAKLYENGELGLAKDMAQARRWTERAAQAGDRDAMHNLGLYYFEGAGGPRNATTAAQWFRRAADLGLTNSQYNLAQLYEQGMGVSQNKAEAYKWYLIAARSGDSESRISADRIKTDLSPQARLGAERAAAAYRPAVANASTVVQPALAGAPGNAASVAQKALSRLGYYQGPRDGAGSPALSGALKAFQRDQGLPQSGQADAATMAKLNVYAH